MFGEPVDRVVRRLRTDGVLNELWDISFRVATKNVEKTRPNNLAIFLNGLDPIRAEKGPGKDVLLLLFLRQMLF